MGSNMSARRRVIAGSLVLVACGLVAAGCGDDSSTTADSTSATTSTTAGDTPAADQVDAAVDKCVKAAQELGSDAGGAALEAACTTVGDNVKVALAQGGAQVEQALQQTADSCKSAVSGLPAGEAQDALTDLCGAIEAG